MLDSIFGKQPRSYWLQCLFWLFVLFMLLGVLAYPLLDVQHNTGMPAIAPGEAKRGGSTAVDIVNYLEPRRVLWATPQGAVTVPLRFALEFNPIILCESAWDMQAVGVAGERGLAQVHPIHDRRMSRMSLDPQVERDRIIMAVALYRERGTQPWSCR
mgnify:CR=1 FL=1